MSADQERKATMPAEPGPGAVAAEHYLDLSAEIGAQLHHSPDLASTLAQVLKLLGQIPAADRVHVTEAIRQDGDWLISQVMRWERGVLSGRDPELQSLSLSRGLPGWAGRLLRGETIHGRSQDFPAAEQAFLNARASRVVLAVPVFCGEVLWGMLVINNLHSDRLWEPAARKLVEISAANLGAALERTASRQALERLNAELSRHVGERDRALAAREALLSNLIDSMQDLIFYKDPQGRYLGCNRAFEAFTGLSAAELLGRRDAEIFTDAWLGQTSANPDQLAAREEWRHVFTVLEDRFAPGEVRTREGWLYRRDGQRIYLETRKMGYYDAGGEIIGYLGVSRDLTERKLFENALIDERERAESANRAKSEFLANMSHEIRTPMNAVIGLNHLLLKTELAPQQRGHVQKAQAAAQNLLGIINDILDFSKIEAGKLDMERIPFDPGEIGMHLSNLLSLRAQEKGLSLKLQLPSLPGLLGDPLRLEQVLLNLASNALKFTEAGEVTLSGVLLETTAERVLLGFEVRDTGIGIAPEQQGQLFQAFSQADNSTTRRYGGTGLGLMICKRLVEMMGGEIGFSSQLGQGSTFWLRVPFARQAELKAGRLAGLQGWRALAVDDQPESLALLQAILSESGCELDLALSGREALAQIEARGAEGYDLLLVDLVLGDSDGLDLIAQCWQQLPRRPRSLLMTAHGRENVLARAAQLPLDGILLKPLTESQLKAALTPARSLGQTQLSEGPDFARALDPVRGARILLVEDNEINQTVARELLASEGFAISVAGNGSEALVCLQAERFDLVLLDLHMPVMDGYTAAARMRANPALEGLPIVAMTADAISGIREQVLAAGMNDYLTKPIVIADLYRALLRWLPPRADSQRRQAGSQASLPQLPGIETAAALARLGGNLGLYLKLLKSFATELPGRLEALAASLLSDRGAAREQAHALKGACGNLGFQALFDCFSACEAAIRDGAGDTARSSLELARAQLAHLLPEIARLELPPAPVLSGADQARLRQDLRQALERYDPSAAELLQSLKACLARPGLCQALEAQIDAFDFEAALEIWDELEPRL